MIDRKKNDKRLYSIEDLEILLENIPYQVWLKDNEGKYIYANKMLLENFGIREEEIIGKRDEEFMDEELSKGCIFTDEETLISNTSVVHEERSIKNNEELWYEVMKFPIEKGNKKYIAGYAKEITLNKKFELETEKLLSCVLDLYKKDEYLEFIEKILTELQEILNCKSVNLFMYEKDTTSFNLFLNSNKSFNLFEEDVEVNIEEKIVKTLQANGMDIDLKNKLYESFKKSYKNNIKVRDNSTCKIYPIKCVDNVIGIIYVYYEDNSLLKYVNEFFVKDVCEKLGNMLINIDSKVDLQKKVVANYILKTEKEKIEEAISIERLKTDFLATISHEFRTPINIMLSSIKLLTDNLNEETKLLDGKNLKYLNILRQNSYRLLRLVNNVVDTTKIYNGFYKINMKNYNIVSVIEEIVLSTVDYVRENKRNIIFDTNEEEVITACDADKIERIILNLISNSIKFTKCSGNIYVEIRANHEEERVYIHVRNDGACITKEESKIIFERFVQSDRILSRRNEGSGIGLFIVKSLIELHEGEIWVNTEIEKGAEFIFYLPIKKIDEDNSFYDFESKADSKIQRCKIEFSDLYSV